MDSEVKLRVSRILQDLVKNDDFWGWVLSGIDLMESTTRTPLASLRWNPTKKKYSVVVNPLTIRKLPDAKIQALMQHELIHRALDHIARGRPLYRDPAIPEWLTPTQVNDLVNVAMDLAVHDMIDPNSLTELLEVGAVSAEQFNISAGKSFEQYFYALLGKAKARAPKKDKDPNTEEKEYERWEDLLNRKEESSDENTDEKNTPVPPGELPEPDSERFPEDPEPRAEEDFEELIREQLQKFHEENGEIPEEDMEEAFRELSRVLEQAKQEVIKAKGSLPGNMEELIKKLPVKKISWRSLLEGMIFNSMGGVRKRSWARPSRSGNPYLPGRAGSTAPKTILFCVDTSMSMGSKELGGAIEVLNKTIEYFPGTRVYIAQGDTRVVELDKAKKGDTLVFKGRGGTDLKIFIDLHFTYKSDLTIIFTDGVDTTSDWPVTAQHIIWLVTTRHNNVLKWAAKMGHRALVVEEIGNA